jgi:hypothetical protein
MNSFTKLIFLLFLTVGNFVVGSAQNQNEPLVNLGRLESTFVRASSVNGSREQNNVFYGVQNLFDGGENVRSNINYTYWLTDASARHWVRMRFATPVEIHKIAIEVNNENAPKAYAIEFQVQKDKFIDSEIFDYVEMKGFLSVFPMNEPIKKVTELTIMFPGSEIISVSEIKILGIPTQKEQTNKKPTIDDK